MIRWYIEETGSASRRTARKGVQQPHHSRGSGAQVRAPRTVRPRQAKQGAERKETGCRELLRRMANVFGAVRMRSPFGCELANPFPKALCFLTNINILKKPLRRNDYMLHRAFMECRRRKHEEKRARKQSAPPPPDNNSDATQDETLTQLLSHSGSNWSPPGDFETPTSERRPSPDERAGQTRRVFCVDPTFPPAQQH